MFKILLAPQSPRRLEPAHLGTSIFPILNFSHLVTDGTNDCHLVPTSTVEALAPMALALLSSMIHDITGTPVPFFL